MLAPLSTTILSTLVFSVTYSRALNMHVELLKQCLNREPMDDRVAVVAACSGLISPSPPCLRGLVTLCFAILGLPEVSPL